MCLDDWKISEKGSESDREQKERNFHSMEN